MSDLRHHETNFNIFVQHQSPLPARQSTPAHVRKRDIEACILTPSIPAGRCAAALWVGHLACWTYCLLVLPRPWDVPKEFPELKKMHFQGSVVSVRWDFGQLRSSAARKIVIFWCSDWPKIVILFHSIACSFESTPHTAARCCKQQQQQKTPRAQQYMSSGTCASSPTNKNPGTGF